jgi:hypothetical protein
MNKREGTTRSPKKSKSNKNADRGKRCNSGADAEGSPSSHLGFSVSVRGELPSDIVDRVSLIHVKALLRDRMEAALPDANQRKNKSTGIRIK